VRTPKRSASWLKPEHACRITVHSTKIQDKVLGAVMAYSDSAGLGNAACIDELRNRITTATIAVPDATLNNSDIKGIATTPRRGWRRSTDTGGVNLDIPVINLEVRCHNGAVMRYSKRNQNIIFPI
jgi:hypothetical protein